MEGNGPTLPFDRRTAVNVIDSLRRGVPVNDPVVIRFLNVGQEQWHASMRTILEEVRDFDVSTLRIVSGHYGDGKSHFLALVCADALMRNFAVARLSAESAPLHKFEDIWKAVLGQIETPQDEGSPAGIRGLLNAWCQAAEGRVPEALFAMDAIRGIDPSFRVALRLYLQAHLDDSDTGEIEQWLLGGRTRPRGVTNRVDTSTAHVMLRSLTKFIKHAGYSGLLLVFDELEHIMMQTRRIRTNSYEAIRQFVDSASNPDSLLWLGACIPKMLDADEGFGSYPALAQRIGRLNVPRGSSVQDFRGTMINLDRTPLSRDDYLSLGSKIRATHSLARGWNASSRVTDGIISKAVERVVDVDFDVAKPRLLVQYFVSTLEIAHQNPGLDIARTLIDDINNAAEAVTNAEASRFSPWDDAN